MAELLVHQAAQVGHVLLREAERAPQRQELAVLQHEGAAVAVVVLPGDVHFEGSPPALPEVRPLLLVGLGLQVAADVLGAAAVERALGVEVGDGPAGHVHGHQRPVHLQVDGDQQQLLAENVHVLGPALHALVAARAQFVVEKGVEEMHLVGHGVHDEVPVHVHYLVVEPVGAVERLQVVHGEHVALVADAETAEQRVPGEALVGLQQLLHRAPPLGGAELLLENVLQLLHHLVGADGDQAPVGLQELVQDAWERQKKEKSTQNSQIPPKIGDVLNKNSEIPPKICPKSEKFHLKSAQNQGNCEENQGNSTGRILPQIPKLPPDQTGLTQNAQKSPNRPKILPKIG